MKELDNNINSLLSQAGLNHSERTVYLAGVASKGQTSRGLIEQTRLPRPTVMAALKSLRQYGLCQTHKRDGRSLTYIMQAPSALKSYLGEQAQSLDTLMTKLDRVDITSKEILEIQEADGQQEVQRLLELALRCKSRKWQIIAPRHNALAYMPKTYTDYFKKVRKERQIESQTLWEAEAKAQNLPLYDLLMRKPRYVPENIGQHIPSLIIAFDDTVLAIEGTPNPSAALIRNKAIVQTFQIVFEMAWRSARE